MKRRPWFLPTSALVLFLTIVGIVGVASACGSTPAVADNPPAKVPTQIWYPDGQPYEGRIQLRDGTFVACLSMPNVGGMSCDWGSRSTN